MKWLITKIKILSIKLLLRKIVKILKYYIIRIKFKLKILINPNPTPNPNPKYL